MMLSIVAIIAFFVGLKLPMGTRIVVLIFDFFLPDPFPFADEIGFLASIVKGMIKE